jgi:hypothetical protein
MNKQMRTLAQAFSISSLPFCLSAQIVVSELMYNPVGGNTNEFVELHNSGATAVDIGGWAFTAGITYSFGSPTVLGPDAYLVVCVNRAAFSALYPGVTNLAPGVYSGQLSNDGETVTLSSAGTPVFSVTYDDQLPWPLAADGQGSSLVLVDPAASPNTPGNWIASAQFNGSPGGPDTFFVQDVVINEVLAHTDPPHEDAVELRNLTTNALSLAGWYLSDDNAVRKKYRFPEGTVIPPLGYLTVYQYQMLGGLVPFSLSAKGDDLYLSEADGADQLVRYVDQYQYDASQNGVSFGRWPDGTGDFVTLAAPTFGVSSPASVEEFRTGAGARNSGPKVGPVVINEIMYHPPATNALGRMPAEYVELLNISGSPARLYNPETPTNTWSLTGGVSFSFPTNLVLQPGRFLLVTATNDLAGFRASYGIASDVVILGPWSKSLNNAGDTVRLRTPNNLELPDNTVARYVADEVTYDDRLPWPLAADGLGGALERTDPSAFGNTPGNWHSSPTAATPGATNSYYLPPGSVVISEVMAVNRSTLRDGDGDFSDWIELHNTTFRAVSLKGWHLTDRPDTPALWTFPDVSIPAYGQLIVFASSKNRTGPNSELHTNFALDAGGEYLALFRDDLTRECAFDPCFPPQTADVSYGFDSVGTRVETPVSFGTQGRCLVPTNAAHLAADWNTQTFDDSLWAVAGNGIGYDTDADYRPLFQTDLYSVMYGKQGSAFVRYSFVLRESADIFKALLRIKFDDGFVAWLNGTLVASNNVPLPTVWNSRASASRSDSLAQVFLDVNLDAFSYLLADGTNVLAFQALNSSSTSSDLLLMSELSFSWTPSAGTAALIPGYLGAPSPGSKNDAAFEGVAPTPALSHPGGVFTGTLSVTVTCANVSATLRCTLDGTLPTASSPLYAGPLTIDGETELLVRAFATGLVPSPVAAAAYRRAFLGINEVMASNVASTPEIADFTDFGDWIELYNAAATPVDLGGYHLSDNLEQPFKWRIPDGAAVPAGGHLLIWADGYDSKPGLTLTRDFWPNTSFVTRSYHANFKLSADGEQIGLFTPSGSLVDGVTFGAQQDDISLGRYPDGGDAWGFFGEATAGRANRPPQLSQNVCRAPAVAVSPAEPLFIAGPVTVTLSAGAGANAIRYTLDSSQPNSSSPLYTNAFSVSTTTVVRARAYAAGLHPGPVVTRTFLVNQRTPELPVVSLVIDPLLLFDPTYGIYTNVLKERDVPGSIQFCTTPSNTAFQIGAGFRLFSLNTFLKPQKPFTVKLGNKYGDAELAYQLFPEKPIGLFDRFVLRNGNDDWAVTFLRDTLGQQMLKGVIKNATQGFRPCASYLNGAYYGLINIQEKMDEAYCAKNYGVDLADIDFFENDGTSSDELLNYGTADGWNALLAYLAANSMTLPANYEYVKSQVDIEDLVDYVAGQVYTDDTAWAHNRKWWRDRNPGGKWRWCFVDLDRAFGNVNDNRLPTMGSSMVVFRELLNNTAFRTYCAQRLTAHLNSSFSASRILPIIDFEAQRIRSEIIEHAKLYGSKGGISSVSVWDAEIEKIRSYARQRPAIALQQVAGYFAGGQTAQVQVDADGTGRVLANYVPLLNGSTNTLLAGMPVTFTAVPAIGQTFAYWVVSNGVSSSSLSSKGSVWSYTVPTNEIAGWNQTAFDDAAWPSGAGQLGYGDGDEATVIGAASDLITSAYFRRTVVVSNAATISSLELQLLRDDGAIVYLNGTEILRSNMPTGAVTFATFASSNITSTSVPNENAYNPFSIVSVPFLEGTNVLAVEIHQSSANYTDFGFDLQALAARASGVVTTNTSPALTFVPDGATPLSVTAVFTPTGTSLLPAVVTGNLTLTAAGSPWLALGDIYVPSNACLTAEPGVTIQMPDAASIYVQGQVRLSGTAEAPVRILPNTNDNARARLYVDPALAVGSDRELRWGGIALNRADHTGILSNVVIRGASLAGKDPVNMRAAVSALGSDLFMHGLDIDDVYLPIFVQEGDSTVLQNSRLRIQYVGDAINIKRARYARVENCEMSGGLTVDTDAIDYDGIQGGIIRGNHIHDFLGDNNDAIDIGEGTLDLLVESNRIERCFDKGVSIGQGSTALVRRNVMTDVDMGLGVKDSGSYGLVENNTFRDVSHAVSVYEKNPGMGGGAAEVRTCIVSHATAAPFACDALSTLSVSYTLSDTEAYPGAGNLLAEPQFLRPSAGNFALQTGSAAVDSGDPESPRDPDGSRADRGAVAFDWREGHAVISEIHYHPADAGQPEFVELTNPGGAPIDLTGYRFSKGLTYTFPEGTALNPGAYLVIASGALPGALVWAAGALDNAGETLELVDAVSNEIDRVRYEPTAPWPAAPDGGGSSLALIHPRWDNARPESWYASLAAGGTPGGPFDNPAAMPTQTITVTTAGRGTADPMGAIAVPCYSTQGFTFTPAEWSTVADVLKDGASLGPVTAFAFTNVLADHTLQAVFADDLAAHDTPKWWLAQTFPGAADNFDAAATGDTDGDGMPNFAEYEAGTQPTNAASVFTIDLATVNGSPVIFVQTIPAGPEYGGRRRYYTLENRESLSEGVWTPVPGFTDIPGTGTPIIYNNPPVGTRFLRVKAELR